MEQRAAIKFCFKLGKSPSETYELVKQAYQNEALGQAMVYRWHKLFREGRESIEDEPRSGCPKSGRNKENIEKIADILKNDRCVSVKMIEEMTGIPSTTAYRILIDDLGKKKVCSRFVPHLLTDDQKTARTQHCLDMKATAEADPNFLKTIITGDETWCFQYEPTTKRQSAEWVGPGEAKPKKLRFQKSKVKTMLLVFYDSKGIVHHEFAPNGQSITGQYYLEVLKRLWARVLKVRPEYKAPGSWSLLHDNAPAHTCLAVRQFLAKKNITVIAHPPYSPDLAPCDFWLFPKLKISMKGHHFDSIPDIEKNVTSFFKDLARPDYQQCFDHFYNRFSTCIASKGDYFE